MKQMKCLYGIQGWYRNLFLRTPEMRQTIMFSANNANNKKADVKISKDPITLTLLIINSVHRKLSRYIDIPEESKARSF